MKESRVRRLGVLYVGAPMRRILIWPMLFLLGAAAGSARTPEHARVLDRVLPLPVALNDDFQFRKTKLYFLTETAPGQGKSSPDTVQGATKGGKLSGNAPSSKTTTVQDASIRFERQYRLFGAVTKLDQRERIGNYFDRSEERRVGKEC